MDPLSFLKSIVNVEQSVPNEPLKLAEGQIIIGKIMRILPNEMAVVQIGSQKLIAKLEISLAANQQYWFEVQSEAGKIRLKLLKENSKQVSNEAIDYTKDQTNNQDGAIEQLFIQVPVQLGKEQSEWLIQWNGRKRNDGKIDPDNCRILFFVELKKMGEVIVDLQFQNRKVKVGIINGAQNIEAIAQSHLSLLKENLQKLNFQLTSLKVDPPPSEKSLKSLIRKTTATEKTVNNYQGMGVDVRV
jgi:hypothetical protein